MERVVSRITPFPSAPDDTDGSRERLLVINAWMPTDCATVRPSATEGSGRSGVGSAVASAVRIARRELESCKGSRMPDADERGQS